MADAFSTTPQSNDLLLRHVVLNEYYDTLESSSTIEIWYNSPNTARRGNITRAQKDFRTSFVKLVSLTRYISQMSGMKKTAEQIDKWVVSYHPGIAEAEYYNTGIGLFKTWQKSLFEQKIVEFR